MYGLWTKCIQIAPLKKSFAFTFMGKQILKNARKMLIYANQQDDVMVDVNFFYHQKKCSLKLDKVMEGWQKIISRFRALARKLILGSIGTLLEHLVLRVLHQTFQVFHFYCNFILGYICRIAVNFGTLKDESLLINIFASNICFSNRNIFQMASSFIKNK